MGGASDEAGGPPRARLSRDAHAVPRGRLALATRFGRYGYRRVIVQRGA